MSAKRKTAHFPQKFKSLSSSAASEGVVAAVGRVRDTRAEQERALFNQLGNDDHQKYHTVILIGDFQKHLHIEVRCQETQGKRKSPHLLLNYMLSKTNQTDKFLLCVHKIVDTSVHFVLQKLSTMNYASRSSRCVSAVEHLLTCYCFTSITYP